MKVIQSKYLLLLSELIWLYNHFFAEVRVGLLRHRVELVQDVFYFEVLVAGQGHLHIGALFVHALLFIVLIVHYLI